MRRIVERYISKFLRRTHCLNTETTVAISVRQLFAVLSDNVCGDGQNTDPQSMDYPNGLPNWTTLKWTKPKNNNRNEYYLIFLAASIIKLHKSSAYVHHVQLLATSLSNYT